MGTVCLYYPNTNEIFERSIYENEIDRTRKVSIILEAGQARQERGAVIFSFPDVDFRDCSEDDIARLCAIEQIKILIQLNKLEPKDVFDER